MTKSDVQEFFKYCTKHPEARLKDQNVIYAPKLFVVNSILNSLKNKIDKKSLPVSTVEFYIECVSGYINGYYDISFIDDELKIIETY